MSLPSSEQWRPVPGREGVYEVSDQGRVRSLPRLDSNGRRTIRGTILSPESRGRLGHLYVGLYGRGNHDRLRRSVHSLVAEVFLGPRPDGQQVRHLDGNPKNNAASNLAYGTLSDNMYDAVRHGTHHQVRKTHCPQGHPYDEANTYHRRGRPNRVCRACTRERKRTAA